MSEIDPPTLALYCTDRGEHSWTTLGDLYVHSNGVGVDGGAVGYGEHAARRKAEAVSIDDQGRIRIWCRRCRRDIQWTNDRALYFVMALWNHDRTAGSAQLDISTIP